VRKSALFFDIWHDLVRYGFTYFIMLGVLLSAFSVVYYSHLNRQSISELEVLLTVKDGLNTEWRNLLLEQNSLAEHSAIESKAKQLLQMVRPEANSEIIINLP